MKQSFQKKFNFLLFIPLLAFLLNSSVYAADLPVKSNLRVAIDSAEKEERFLTAEKYFSEPKSEIEVAWGELERSAMIALENYSNVHRGAGHHSIVSTELFELSRKTVLEYFKLDPKKYTVIFSDPRRLGIFKSRLGKNTEFHEIYSRDIGLPLGIGAIAVRKKDVPKGVPFQTGGGVVKLVSRNFVIWSDSPEKFETGTPNIMGVIMFARALSIMDCFMNQDVFKEKNESDAMKPRDILYKSELTRYGGKLLLSKLKETLIGRGALVPVLEGEAPYVNFDNGASTPTFSPIWDVVRNTLKQNQETLNEITGEVENICSEFLGAPKDKFDFIFTSNTTDGLNIFADSFRDFSEKGVEPVVLNTLVEHHSNELPWRYVPGLSFERLAVNEKGFISLEQLENKLKEYNKDCRHGNKRIKVVSVSGASNVLGSLNDIKEISRIAHKYGASIMVDAAQLAAHRKIDMENSNIDFLVLSGHKMYAPFGSGLLVARKGYLRYSEEDLDNIKEAGKENAAGIAAMGKAMDILRNIGMAAIEEEEKAMTSKTLKGLSEIKNVQVFGISDPEDSGFFRKGGVVTFSVRDIPHNIVAARLAEIGGIGTRNGCFCAHLLIKSLVGIGRIRDAVANAMTILVPKLSGKMLPGLVRVSFGIENTEEEVDIFLLAIKKVAGEKVSFVNRLIASTYNGTPFMPKTEEKEKIAWFVENQVEQFSNFGPDALGQVWKHQRKLMGEYLKQKPGVVEKLFWNTSGENSMSVLKNIGGIETNL